MTLAPPGALFGSGRHGHALLSGAPTVVVSSFLFFKRLTTPHRLPTGRTFSLHPPTLNHLVPQDVIAFLFLSLAPALAAGKSSSRGLFNPKVPLF